VKLLAACDDTDFNDLLTVYGRVCAAVKTGVSTSLYQFRHGWAHHHVTVRKTDIVTLGGWANVKMLAAILCPRWGKCRPPDCCRWVRIELGPACD
jgi:hypothetical protein